MYLGLLPIERTFELSLRVIYREKKKVRSYLFSNLIIPFLFYRNIIVASSWIVCSLVKGS